MGSWSLAIDDFRVRIDGVDASVEVDVDAIAAIVPDESSKSVAVAVKQGPTIVLRGAPRRALHQIADAFAAQLQARRRQEQLLATAIAQGKQAAQWWAEVARVFERPRWVDRESANKLEDARPDVSQWIEAEKDSWLAQRLATQPEDVRSAVKICRTTAVPELVSKRNEGFVAWESNTLADYFGTVENSPLIPEQIRATICFDNRVRVIASAGSGKTSTMVARAGYAIRREIVQPKEVLALAFNAKAAEELSSRLGSRLGKAGTEVTSSTFHAFGLSVIGKATGRKPSPADDLTHDNGIERMSKVVDSCRDKDDDFRRNWDIFRLVFGRPLAGLGEDVEDEAFDRKTNKRGFETLAGEIVKSQEEVMIANWLFINGVKYEYERSYHHDLADAEHRQYHPDFYYPEIDTWHEHLALGPDGTPPAKFKGYAEKVAWAREVHHKFQTRLIETTSATIRDGSGFTYLEAELRRRGITMDENPYRRAAGKPPVEDKEVISLMRTFLVHVKGNRLTVDRIRRRIGQDLRGSLFLRLFEVVAAEWDRQLRAEDSIDFEDMLNLATDHIRAGRWKSPYRLVMVDEMQDTSASRAALVRALTESSDSYLYAVGDDWQSINRFAGSDLGIMTRFDDWFGPSSTVLLSRTFRSPQSLCDIAGDFVMKNSSQISKSVTSTAADMGETVELVGVKDSRDYDSVLELHLSYLDGKSHQRASVLVLGRYTRSKNAVVSALRKRRKNLVVEYSTVHKAKGKEADYVVVLEVERNKFPSTIADDPLVQVAMAAGDRYPFAEDRRLFYVALTRARRAVLLLTRLGNESQFLVELVGSGALKLKSASGSEIEPVICPKCTTRTMAIRSGKFGQFYGCTGFPLCTGTKKVRSS